MARYALVIGIGENQHPLRSLTKTVGDAKAIAQVLRKHGGFHVELSTQPKQVQYKALKAAIQTFVQQRAAGDEALIYYTGHGFPLVKDFDEMEAFLAPADCSVALEGGQVTSQQNGLSLASLNRLVAKASFSNLVMLLDCCHSGYLLEDELLRQTFVDFSQKDYWLMTACRSFEQAYANKSDPHSVFTGAVLTGLERTRADEQGVITVGSLFEYVQRRLRQEQQEVLQLAVGRPIELLRFQLEQPTIKPDETVEPYRGLDAFTPETAEFFFGREAEIQALVQQVYAHCFVPLIGASGSGKSSLVRAGLVPRLQELGWQVLEPIKPGSNPIAELKLALRSALTEDGIGEDEISRVYEYVDRQDLATVITGLPEPQRWLLVMDQFEEVFTLCTDRGLQAAFIQTLTSAMQQETPRLTIVTTMRADFVESCLAYGALTQVIQSQAMYLGAMTREGLEAAIVQPAKRLNYGVEERLLAEMLRDVETEANSLPLLQFALQQLWVQRDRARQCLTYAVYQQLGGVAGALNQKADAVYYRLEAEGQGDWVRRVLLKLVRTGEGTKDTRQRRFKTDLLEIGTDSETRRTIDSVIAALVDERLLVSDRANDQDVIDLSHEAIIQRWRRLAKWREQDRDLRRLVDRIDDAQRDWLKQGRKRQDLLQGRLLKDARRLLEQQAGTVAGAQVFVKKSLYWRRMQFAATLLVPVFVLGVPAEYFWREDSAMRDYDQILLPDALQGQRASVRNLEKGCWAKKQHSQIPEYFRERFFGYCRSLKSAGLEKASLSGENLSGANLSGANLSGADLNRANLSNADLNGANLSGAHLFGADLSGANLNGTNLSSTVLGGANLKNVRFGCSEISLSGKPECTNLENIQWYENTQWQGIKDWDKVKNIPPALKKQLGLR
jgi:Caspase domain/Pentapeptide repeats (8 copies)